MKYNIIMAVIPLLGGLTATAIQGFAWGGDGGVFVIRLAFVQGDEQSQLVSACR